MGSISKSRVMSSMAMIVLAVLAVVNNVIFFIVQLLITGAGLYEFFYMIKKKGIPIYRYIGIPIGLLIPCSIFFRFELTKNWELLFIVIALLLILFMQFVRKDNSNAIVGISTTIFGVLYVSWFFSFLIKIRYLLPGEEGIRLLGYILLVTKGGDIGALLVGTYYGKHPLLPRISPNKSIEGCLGNVAFSIIIAILGKSFLPSLDLSLIQTALLGAFFGGLGQLGDLSESLMKRDCNVKDSGKLLPGMGGILDIIDSLLFSAPAFYLYMSAALHRF